MSSPHINANIQETETGIFYHVKLHVVPRVGDEIELFSYTEQRDKKPPVKNYKVVSIRHDIHESTDAIPISKNGAHSIVIYVEPV